MTQGRIAFEAYNKDRGGLNHKGEKTPEWQQLPEEIRHAWDAAAQALSFENQIEQLVHGSKNFLAAGILLRLANRLQKGESDLVQVSIQQEFEKVEKPDPFDPKDGQVPINGLTYTFKVREL